jgi:3-methyladenine DNA glycosylase AlkC
MMGERRAFKDYFDGDLVRRVGGWLREAEPRFDHAGFVRRASRGLGSLEMMGRVGHIADAMRAALPGPTAVVVRALVASLPPPAQSDDGITDYGYALWPYGELIARHGLDDVDASFAAMVELTQRFSSEFAVRPFLAADPDDLLDRLEALITHESEHVRRWVSEGTRTRLPWGKRVPALEARLGRRLTMLGALRRDPSRYVQRSVANHLGDVLKDDRERGLECLEAWAAEDDARTAWIVRHAARGPLKEGDPRALALFGHAPSADLSARLSARPKRLVVGETVTLTAHVTNTGEQSHSARADYRLESPGAGARPIAKTFRLADLELGPGERAERAVRHAFVPRTIRAVRPGVHRFVLLLNGLEAARADVRIDPRE